MSCYAAAAPAPAACVAPRICTPHCLSNKSRIGLGQRLGVKISSDGSEWFGSSLASAGVKSRKEVRDVSGHGLVRAGFLDVFTKPFENVSAKRTTLKSKLLEAIEPLDRGCDASPEDREQVENIISELEKITPIKDPLKSSAINGKWKLVYTTSDSILGTNKPKFLRPSGPIYQCIDAESLQALNLETTPFFNQVRATLTPVNTKKVNVKFDYFKILGLISVKAPDSARGDLETTYLDDEMRISRGNRGNVFVLLMDDPEYRII